MPIINIRKVQFPVNGEKLIGNTVSTDDQRRPTFLFLHGAGNSNKTRSTYIAVELAKHGINSFSFDFSGHGESTGALGESSLQKRIAEATAALAFMNLGDGITVYGSSMGAHIALELTRLTKVNTLVLFCPAIYGDRAVPVPFSKGFSKIIRRPDSWKASSVFDLLRRFAGKLLVIIGERDEVIPKEVIAAIESNATATAAKQIVWLPGAPHQIHAWLEQNPEYAERVISAIIRSSSLTENKQ